MTRRTWPRAAISFLTVTAVSFALNHLFLLALAWADILQAPSLDPRVIAIEFSVALVVGVLALVLEAALSRIRLDSPNLSSASVWSAVFSMVLGLAMCGVIAVLIYITYEPSITGESPTLPEGGQILQSAQSSQQCLGATEQEGIFGIELSHVHMVDCSETDKATWVVRSHGEFESRAELYHPVVDECLAISDEAVKGPSAYRVRMSDCDDAWSGLSLFERNERIVIAVQSACVTRTDRGVGTARGDACDETTSQWLLVSATE